MNNQELKNELKRLLISSEIAQSKVIVTRDSSSTENPKQQGAASRLYRKASDFAKANDLDILPIHEKVMQELSPYRSSL